MWVWVTHRSFVRINPPKYYSILIEFRIGKNWDRNEPSVAFLTISYILISIQYKLYPSTLSHFHPLQPTYYALGIISLLYLLWVFLGYYICFGVTIAALNTFDIIPLLYLYYLNLYTIIESLFLFLYYYYLYHYYYYYYYY